MGRSWRYGTGVRISGGPDYKWYEYKAEGHPRANERGYVKAHILIVEEALNKFLPMKAVVHHVDKDGMNIERANLVACEDQAYHLLLHMREAALKACGHVNWRKCKRCGQWDDPNNSDLRIYKRRRDKNGSGEVMHASCNRLYIKSLREKRENGKST